MIVAVDGPAASGKGTIARALASHFGFAHLDTGLTYRAVAQHLLCRGERLDDEAAAVAAAEAIDLGRLDAAALATREIAEAASVVAVMPALRKSLVARQRAFAEAAGERGGGVILDGRDIGTVVCPTADVKIFVTAETAVRARRRFAETAALGDPTAYETILSDLERRDARDMGREASPLRPAADAVILDTSAMTVADALRAAIDIVEKHQRA